MEKSNSTVKTGQPGILYPALSHRIQGVLYDDSPIIWKLLPDPQNHRKEGHGRKGEIIQITGGRFGTDKTKVQVLFTGIPGKGLVEAEITDLTELALSPGEGSIWVKVPNGADTGLVDVVVNGVRSYNPAQFTYDWKLSTELLPCIAGAAAICYLGGRDIYYSVPSLPAIHNLYYPVITGNELGSPTGISNSFIATDNTGHKINKLSTFEPKITLLAGTGIPGFADGVSNRAMFNGPFGIATDADHNSYVTDTNNHRIRMIDKNGNVTTIAGSGTPGNMDSDNPHTAQFSAPSGICLDENGNIYVTDHHCIRKISKTGNVFTGVTTIAGSNIKGHTDGLGANAKFSNPKGITTGPFGNLYVADTENGIIRVIENGNRVSTLQPISGLRAPTGIVAVGSNFGDGEIWVADPGLGSRLLHIHYV